MWLYPSVTLRSKYCKRSLSF